MSTDPNSMGRVNPASIRAELINFSNSGWVVKTEKGDLHRGIPSIISGLRPLQWVTMIALGYSWVIVGTATNAPDGGGE